MFIARYGLRSPISTDLRVIQFTDGADHTGDDQRRCARSRCPFARCRVLFIRRGGDGERARGCRERAGSLVIGVVGGLGQCSAVEGDADIGENRVEGIGDHGAIRFAYGDVTAVLQLEGIAQLAVFRYGDRCDRLDDRQHRLTDRGDGVGIGHIAYSCAGDGHGVLDGARRIERRVLIDGRLIDDHGVAVIRYADTADRETRGGRHSGIGLQDAVAVILHGARDIAQRLNGAGVEDIRAEIVGNGQTCYRSVAVVDDADDIGHGIARGVDVAEAVFGYGENALEDADSDIRLHAVAVIAQGRLICKSCSHCLFLSCVLPHSGDREQDAPAPCYIICNTDKTVRIDLTIYA